MTNKPLRKAVAVYNWQMGLLRGGKKTRLMPRQMKQEICMEQAIKVYTKELLK